MLNHTSITEKLAAMGLEWPPITQPGGRYVSVNQRGNIAYIAIQFPIVGNQYLYQGILGDNLTTEAGIQAMQLCALNLLAQIDQKIGWENLLGINHVDAYYRATTEWDDAPLVVDGASALLETVLGEAGRHSRAILGVAHLPRQFSVGISATVSCL